MPSIPNNQEALSLLKGKISLISEGETKYLKKGVNLLQRVVLEDFVLETKPSLFSLPQTKPWKFEKLPNETFLLCLIRPKDWPQSKHR